MLNPYSQKAHLSSSEVAAFLKEKGLDFAAWPQSALPDELLAAIDRVVEDNIERKFGKGESFKANASEYREKTRKKYRIPQAILKTSWRLLIGHKMEADPKNDMDFGTYSVDVHYAKGWNNDALGAYCDACTELLGKSLGSFRKKNRKADVSIGEGSQHSILDLIATFELEDGKAGEQNAQDGLVRYLIEILETGTLDKVIAVGCADDLEEGAAAGLLMGGRPDLHAKVS